jgi:uncharacterized delta-60 repeat protein
MPIFQAQPLNKNSNIALATTLALSLLTMACESKEAPTAQPSPKTLTQPEEAPHQTPLAAFSSEGPSGEEDLAFAEKNAIPQDISRIFPLTPLSYFDDTSLPSMAVASDGRIFVPTSAGLASDNFLVIGLNPDGSLNTSFGMDGVAEFNIAGGTDLLNLIGIQNTPQGERLILIGRSQFPQDSSFQLGLLALDLSGKIDPTFRAASLLETSSSLRGFIPTSMIFQSDGKIIIGGSLHGQLSVIRLMSDGEIDREFGSAGIFKFGDSELGKVYDLALQNDGNTQKIIAVGTYRRTSTIVRLTAEGRLDPTFAGNGILQTAVREFQAEEVQESEANSVVVLADGSLIVSGVKAGWIADYEGFYRMHDSDIAYYVQKLSPEGNAECMVWRHYSRYSTVTDHWTPRFATVDDMILQSDSDQEKVLLSVRVTGPGGSRYFIIRYNTDLSLDDGNPTEDPQLNWGSAGADSTPEDRFGRFESLGAFSSRGSVQLKTTSENGPMELALHPTGGLLALIRDDQKLRIQRFYR